LYIVHIDFKIFHLYCLYVITWDPTVTMWHCQNVPIYPLFKEPPEDGVCNWNMQQEIEEIKENIQLCQIKHVRMYF